MKKTYILPLLMGLSGSLFAQTPTWSPVKGKIASPWAEKVNPAAVHQEYPRPQFERKDWKNLNGLWDYAIAEKSATPSINQGKILVPFAVESSLSGVGRIVGKDSLLWYKTQFSIPSTMKGKQILLHFGAVDWKTTVLVNGKEVGVHEGGNDPFSFNITSFLAGKGNQELVVKVWDPTDAGPQPRGKQVNRPEGIWYTAVTGIWQTVWIEGVNAAYLANVRITPDVDAQSLELIPTVAGVQPGDKLRITALDGASTVASMETEATQTINLGIGNPKLWSPSNPFLYDLKLELVRNGKVIDEVKSYFAMRKISWATDPQGIRRMLLNNKFLFQYGPLDQGWWPDGLYTAPSDEALLFDVVKTKEMGFNMIRKHMKTEPARWYYHCDKEGMLVWQDMPSGDLGNHWENRPGVLDKGTDKKRSPESEAIFRKEWKSIMEAFHNSPSIVVWTPFNEAWGQFKTQEIVHWTEKMDPSRLINAASGGNFEPVGDMIDLHNYPHPAMPDPAFFGKDYVLVLGEFGGLGLPVDNHVWQQKDNWGYQSFKNQTDLYNRYAEYIKRMKDLIRLGLSAAVYTQTTDVEVETNGLMTYDRKVIKFPEAKMKEIHSELYDPALAPMKK
ncbi:MAG: glycoside hydrolase family 2 TIM barrel-domain containing protein [Candidatus Pseudobacter hemicellulosilyticus]|uniref:Glycoside hydrolase family 2 TIM barrel-domain containing protein n=1 Tax=Candidatus Pseudobacter hemicellulosilyticus TaxID=3121375 RepID=A0AAJ6BIM8_9BACT|nr:MAG: glycoside hydrolase family 2 TIM barrel-domain containing protein [Pseudobacter sp.]